jgi:hypothetical protein
MPFRNLEPAAERVIASVWGHEKAGKSTLALTFPEPVRVMNFNFGIAPLRRNFPGKVIEESQLYLQTIGDMLECSKLLGRFYQDYLWAVQNACGGTVVVDTASELWQLIYSVKLEEVKARRAKKKKEDPDDVEVYPFDYNQANVLMSSILSLPWRYPDVNAVFIHQAKVKWEGKQETQQLEPHWFKQTPAITGVTIQMKKSNGAYLGVIERCRDNGSLEGMEVKDLDYDTLRDLCFPGVLT